MKLVNCKLINVEKHDSYCKFICEINDTHIVTAMQNIFDTKTSDEVNAIEALLRLYDVNDISQINYVRALIDLNPFSVMNFLHIVKNESVIDVMNNILKEKRDLKNKSNREVIYPCVNGQCIKNNKIVIDDNKYARLIVIPGPRPIGGSKENIIIEIDNELVPFLKHREWHFAFDPGTHPKLYFHLLPYGTKDNPDKGGGGCQIDIWRYCYNVTKKHAELKQLGDRRFRLIVDPECKCIIGNNDEIDKVEKYLKTRVDNYIEKGTIKLSAIEKGTINTKVIL